MEILSTNTITSFYNEVKTMVVFEHNKKLYAMLKTESPHSRIVKFTYEINGQEASTDQDLDITNVILEFLHLPNNCNTIDPYFGFCYY